MTELRGRFDDVVMGSNITGSRRRRLHNANDDASANIVNTSHLSGTADNEARNVDGSRPELLDAFLGHVISDTMDLSAGDQVRTCLFTEAYTFDRRCSSQPWPLVCMAAE